MKQLEVVPLSDKTKEIILGSLLGDGSLKIHPKYKNARFSFRHSETQKDYFLWKVSMLKEISSNNCIFNQKSDGYSNNHKLRYQSKAIVELTQLYNLTSKNNNLVIKRRWLNHLTALSLAIWWFDDGSLISNGRKGVFCTDGFNQESVKILSQYLLKVWNIKTVVAPISRKRDSKQAQYWRLWIRSTEELKKFLNIILPYTFAPSMLKKVMIMYNDRQLQQRWISEIMKSTSFSRQEVEKQLELKKRKWKQYQKKI